MKLGLTDEIKQDIDSMSLEDLRVTILVEMKQKPAWQPEVCDYLLEAFENRLAELYW
jgi:hypothetical protein